jgi:hypothetical protein
VLVRDLTVHACRTRKLSVSFLCVFQCAVTLGIVQSHKTLAYICKLIDDS